MSSQMACCPLTSDNNSQQTIATSEQLHLPLIGEEHGIPPLRLLEPIASLNLTPFAAKAARGIGAATVGDLSAFVFDPSKECRGLGQGHIEEIRRKIEGFVGKPPYRREQGFDIASLLRLSLCDIDPRQRALIVSRCQMQQIAPLSPQESREAEGSLVKDKDQKFQQTIEKNRLKTSEKILPLLDTIFCGLIKPWMAQRGGFAHEREIFLFLYEAQNTSSHPPEGSKEGNPPFLNVVKAVPMPKGNDSLEYRLFEKGLTLLKLLTGLDFLFSRFLCPVEGKIWALSSPEQLRTQAILQDAQMLIGQGKEGIHLRALAKAVEECRFEQWDSCACANIERLLFWHYLEQ